MGALATFAKDCAAAAPAGDARAPRLLRGLRPWGVAIALLLRNCYFCSGVAIGNAPVAWAWQQRVGRRVRSWQVGSLITKRTRRWAAIRQPISETREKEDAQPTAARLHVLLLWEGAIRCRGGRQTNWQEQSDSSTTSSPLEAIKQKNMELRQDSMRQRPPGESAFRAMSLPMPNFTKQRSAEITGKFCQIGVCYFTSVEREDHLQKHGIFDACENAVRNAKVIAQHALDDNDNEDVVAPDAAISFRQLFRHGAGGKLEDLVDDDLFAAVTGADNGDKDGNMFAQRLDKMVQMTGLADPVYVEAFVQYHGNDIMVEFVAINRTDEVLQKVTIDVLTIGDLLVVEKPQPFFLEPRQQVSARCGIRASACQSGIILGHVFYEKKSADDKSFIYMDELNVDILEYLEKAWVNELQFRTMWSEFEWENKININTSITDISQVVILASFCTAHCDSGNGSLLARMFATPVSRFAS
eukprot:gene226-727_t